MIKSLLFSIILMYCMIPPGHSQMNVAEFANYNYYQSANEQLLQQCKYPQVVFMGNSITQNWASMRPDFFKDNNFVGRGIGGQVSHQMLLRFHQDVVALNPKQVAIMAGTNDIAQNAGSVNLEMIMDNVKAMTEIARQNKIQVILCSVPPAIKFPWRPSIKPVESIMALNNMIKRYAMSNDIPYVDYFDILKDTQNGMKVPEYTTEKDLVHPNAEAYKVMEALILPVIQ